MSGAPFLFLLGRAPREGEEGGVEVECKEAGTDSVSASGYPVIEGGAMLFMVIERFKNRDGKAVYRHFLEKGRGLPEGLTFVGSWIEANLDRCFQLMECNDARLLQRWVLHWQGLIEFEIVPVVPSKETLETITPFL